MAAVLDVEQPTVPPSSAMTGINFEELFNMELFGPSSSSANHSQGGPSRGSSHSPNSSFFSLPPTTPPQTDAFNTIAVDAGMDPSFFNFGAPQNTFTKPVDSSANGASPSDETTSPASSAPFDFFASLTGSNSSPETAPSSAFSPKDMFAIDPSLVGAPSPVLPQQPSQPQHRSEPEDDSDDDSDEEDTVKPVKVGGKGKAARKGTVASGGVVKRTPGGNAVKDKQANDDDWRPSPEEYKKMSSKEKRQLRNKISARNFRVRRKEYISTLEGDIAERDRLIDAIRDELGSTKHENVALRQEVDALKRAMLEGRASPVLPPPAPLTASTANTKRATRTLAKPNTQKDLPTSPRASGARAFWAGSNGGFGGAGGITPVHATLVPDFPALQPQLDQQENINPALNLPCFGGVGTTTPNPKFPLTPFQQPNLGANFDAFTDLNPFTLKTLDAYRMQLWGRMAREAGAQQQQMQQQQQQQRQSPAQSQALTNALRPAFFTASATKEKETAKYTSPTLSALLSGKPPRASTSTAPNPNPYPTPPSSPPSRAAEIQPGHAMLASLASQTLLSKMGSAFWDAFAHPVAGSGSGAAPNSSAPARKADWDHDKVRRVLEGKAVVRVVDVDTPPVAPVSVSSSADALEESMRSLSIAGQAEGATPCPCPNTCGAMFARTRAAVVGKK